MKDIVKQLRSWQQQGKRYALATLVKVDRSAPKPAGAAMAVCEDGTVAGSVSGGCVESALHTEAMEVITTGTPKTVSYGITDDEGFTIGLACGGELHLFVDRAVLPSALLDGIEAGRPLALATVVSGAAAGLRVMVDGHGQAVTLPAHGSGESAPPSGLETVSGDASALLARRATQLITYPQGEVFVQSFAPPAEMYVFGAADFSAAVTRIGKFLGYHVTVIDPRAVFATRERFPDADELVVEWPDKFLAGAPIDRSTAIVILTHDPKLDIPALVHALKTDAGYIGAMGARKTNEARFRRLREAGCTEEQLARIHAPIGLDIGGRTPEETAVSIAAQIIALRSGKKPASQGA